MKIQPNAHNSIDIELDDGAIFSMHDAFHGSKCYLAIHCKEANTQIDLSRGLQWESLPPEHLIRISRSKQ